MVRVDNDPGRDRQTLPESLSSSTVVDAVYRRHPGAQPRLEALSEVVQAQAALLRREDEVHRVLVKVVLAGGSLAEVCAAVAGVFGGAAVITASDGRVLATGGAESDLQRALGLDCFDRTGRLIVEREPVGLRSIDGPADLARALVRIVAGSSEHGLLAAFSLDKAFGSTDIHVLERAATVAALAIIKEQAVAAVEGRYRSEFLRDLLSGRAGGQAEAAAHATSLGWQIDRPVVVVVAETDENDAETTRRPDEVRQLQERFARAWTQAVRTRDDATPVAGFSQEVVALVAVEPDADAEAVLRPVSELARIVRGDGGGGRRTFATGVSRTVSRVAELPSAYEEARTAVRVGRQVGGMSGVAHFEQLGIYRLLALIPDSAELRSFVADALGELATDDVPENANLRLTLGVLLDTGLNVAETARRLFFHYNTLRYRIAKLERILGPFMTDPELRLRLSLALKVHQMRGLDRS